MENKQWFQNIIYNCQNMQKPYFAYNKDFIDSLHKSFKNFAIHCKYSNIKLIIIEALKKLNLDEVVDNELIIAYIKKKYEEDEIRGFRVYPEQPITKIFIENQNLIPITQEDLANCANDEQYYEKVYMALIEDVCNWIKNNFMLENTEAKVSLKRNQLITHNQGEPVEYKYLKNESLVAYLNSVPTWDNRHIPTNVYYVKYNTDEITFDKSSRNTCFEEKTSDIYFEKILGYIEVESESSYKEYGSAYQQIKDKTMNNRSKTPFDGFHVNNLVFVAEENFEMKTTIYNTLMPGLAHCVVESKSEGMELVEFDIPISYDTHFINYFSEYADVVEDYQMGGQQVVDIQNIDLDFIAWNCILKFCHGLRYTNPELFNWLIKYLIIENPDLTKCLYDRNLLSVFQDYSCEQMHGYIEEMQEEPRYNVVKKIENNQRWW